MSKAIRLISRLLAVSLPITLGALTVAYSDNLAQPPAAKESLRSPTAVRVVTMAPIDMVPRVSGYGTVEPAREWRAIARVEAEVVETAPDLANGKTVDAGAFLLRLDDTDLKLSLAQIDAQLAALAVKDQTLAASLDLASADLELSRGDLARQKSLAQEGVATQARVDTALRAELSARSKVVEVENQLSLNAAERDVLKAQQAAVARSLEFTEITAPYDIRIGEVSAELGQVVNRGQVLLTAEGLEAAEIAAQFSMGRIGPLLRAAGDGATVLDLKAKVRLAAPGHSVMWDATIDRIGEEIDPRTQSTAIVVRVEDPYAQAEAGARPPLRRNTFVEVILTAPKRPALIAPLDAVRGGKALIVSPESTLEKREVTIGYTIGDIAVISAGLAEGDKLVVTDPAIAVPGMAVKPMEDSKLLAQIVAAAGGQSKGSKQ
ncbi:Multidrug transporter MdtA [Thalassovita gelatinovora]|uniref:Multidrug transporter MdtA n=1 Tax=Thalassovita gelatinovora TaxID=53501 RepID=A0A0P1G6T7_THAGE|nr:HlyD family efflux transporter periplasmic adaptor subunit [Thalassovita gelatinovora]QIZ82179.1 HlyD family efflux transporter periplasmic adaptor subunit [Thalassovita gelatinovora]CUH67797.1 Multidrug transporter MdtA [Thalassovita gelatinovora]SEP67190.1 RND family efflux transporter, MFP subunit [Thalassovita gelatinovora]